VQALRQLSKNDQNIVLWVDTICVNQSNLVERGNQVKIMGDIYRSATQAISWLGEATDMDEQAILCIKWIDQESLEPIAQFIVEQNRTAPEYTRSLMKPVANIFQTTILEAVVGAARNVTSSKSHLLLQIGDILTNPPT
jgi:hypothetical protein